VELTGAIAKHNGSFGFIQVDGGGAPDMFVMPGACAGFDSTIPPIGTQVRFVVVADAKTGRPRAEKVRPAGTALFSEFLAAAGAAGDEAQAQSQALYDAQVTEILSAQTNAGSITDLVATSETGPRTGTVLKWDGRFGFIAQDCGEADMFVMPNACDGLGTLPQVGQRVVYSVVTDTKTGRPRAEHVRPDHAEVSDGGGGARSWGPPAEAAVAASGGSWGPQPPSAASAAAVRMLPPFAGGDGASARAAAAGPAPPHISANGATGYGAARFGSTAYGTIGYCAYGADGGGAATGRKGGLDSARSNPYAAPTSQLGGGLGRAPLLTPTCQKLSPALAQGVLQDGMRTGTMLKDSGRFGFVKQDEPGAPDMFVMPVACAAFDGMLPPVGTRLRYHVVADEKTGRPRAEGVLPLHGA